MNAAQAIRLIRADVAEISTELTAADERCEDFGNRKGETVMERHEYCAALFGEHELPKLLARVSAARRMLAEALTSCRGEPVPPEVGATGEALDFTHAKILHFAAVNWSAAGVNDKADRANREGLALLQNAGRSVALMLKGRLQADLGLRNEAIATYRLVADMDDEEDALDALRAIRALEARPEEPARRDTPSISPVLGMIFWVVVVALVIKFALQ